MKRSTFNGIIESINRRLASWKGRLLNKAGHVCLAKSVITSIPVYQMQVLFFPKAVCNDIDRLTRNFIWNGRASVRYCSLVSWNKVTTPKRNGGLGIRDAHFSNLALLDKLVWSLLHDDNKIWPLMLKHKYFRNTRVLDGS